LGTLAQDIECKHAIRQPIILSTTGCSTSAFSMLHEQVRRCI
jgi:hypothetical protein